MHKNNMARAVHDGLIERKDDAGGEAPAVGEIKTLLEKQGRAWEEFKAANDERLKKLEKGESVAELEVKLNKINKAVEESSNELVEISKRLNRKGLGDGGDSEGDQKELKRFNATAQAVANEKGRVYSPLDGRGYADYKNGVTAYLRRGIEQMSDAERKAINVGSDPQGGYLVGETTEAGIDRVVQRFSAMRQLARVIQIGTPSYKKLVKVTGTSGATTGNETTAPTQGTSQTWSELEFRTGTYLSDQRITSEALEDAVQDVEADLTEEIGIELGEKEGQDFINGDGVNGPRGIQSYTMIANASYAWGKTGFIVSGAAAAFAASNPSDALIDLQHALKRQYRAGASWTMNDAVLGTIRKFKDGQGNYLWAPSGLLNGAVGVLLGHPVVTDDFMPDLAANAFPVAFADFKRAYYVVDRKGIMILRDPYTAVPYVKFITRKRIGGGIANFEAVKFLKCST
jgi:HK97 family phage major capsid protein